MSRSSGTGSPIHFRCHMARQSWHAAHRLHPEALVRVRHEVTLTGRTRPYRNRYHALGGRSTLVSREYRCTCGHVGWSNHSDLERTALYAAPTPEREVDEPLAMPWLGDGS